MTSLPFQEVKVPAVRLIGVLMANARSRVIDRATALFRVEEHADASEEFVLLMTQHVFTFDLFGEASFGRFGIDPEVAREPVQIALLDDDAVVAAAAGRALGAIVMNFLFGTVVG